MSSGNNGDGSGLGLLFAVFIIGGIAGNAINVPLLAEMGIDVISAIVTTLDGFSDE